MEQLEVSVMKCTALNHMISWLLERWKISGKNMSGDARRVKPGSRQEFNMIHLRVQYHHVMLCRMPFILAY